MSERLKGTGVALATPMNKDYTVDWSSLHTLIDHTINGGVEYLVIMGTTGESPVFTWKEMLEILDFSLEKVDHRVPVVFGVGGNDTEVVVNKSKDVKSFNLEAVLSVCPYYNNPSQNGIIRHFNMIADASEFPVILYNVPGRTVTNMEAETTLTLSRHSNIVAIKEASGDLGQAEMIIQNTPDDFLVLSGNDENSMVMIELGADGVISVIANLLPKNFSEMIRKALHQDYHEATELNNHLKPFYDLLSREGNPVSLKAGLEAMGLCARTVKPPLYDATQELFEAFHELLKTKKGSY